MNLIRWWFFLVPWGFLFSEEPCLDACLWSKEVRRNALKQIDLVISGWIPFSARSFSFFTEAPVPLETKNFVSLQQFSEQYGFLSCVHPLVGVVTSESIDSRRVEEAFASLYASSYKTWGHVACGELLAKALAYRALSPGFVLSLPVFSLKSVEKVDYIVDEVLDLWMGMPAFGLIPLHGKAEPLLLFRGTDCSFFSSKAAASILSDLDVTGIGLSTFRLAQPLIHAWLDKALQLTGKKAQVQGFSLGGALALYTVLFEGDLVADKGSMAFNAPGLFQEVWEKFDKPFLTQISLYATQGDLVSKMGRIVFPSFVLSTDEHLSLLEAHTRLMFATEPLYLQEIAGEEENKHRFID
ncbi:MAG: hypothetical protein FJZ58_01040 [Chlamydiae bacterium]|nr:hypothetical protein [Chlamydiota bacterium]